MSGDDTPIAARLAEFTSGLRAGSLPQAVRDDARRRLEDTVGVCLAGSRLDYAPIVAGLAGEQGGAPQAHTIGFGQQLPAPLAGFVNAALAHGPDYDDTHSLAMVHISCLVVPAALAMGELVGASGAEVAVAMVAGAEVGLRIGAAAPHRFHLRGLHATGIMGPFAAAATGARVLGLDASQTANALGLAGSQAAGLRQSSQDGSWVKRLHPAWAVQSGLTAALLAARGFTGPRAVIEGSSGLYAAMLHGEPVETGRVTEALGERWFYPETVFKPYPNGAWNHSSMDGVMAIMRREGLGHADVARIDVTVPMECMPAVCEPRDARIHPRTPYHMKFSLPYSVALLAINGSVGVDDYNEETHANPVIADFAARVFCHADDGMSPAQFPAIVRVTTRSGAVHEESIAAQRGGPLNPMTGAEHRAKFMSNAAPSLGADRAAELWEELEGVWEAVDVRQMLRRASGGADGGAG